MDADLIEEPHEEVDRKPIGQRNPWWEMMVAKIIEGCGRITIV
jgi:hypothetical protein